MSDWLLCDSCDFGYAGGPGGKYPGDRCNDLSWRHHDYPAMLRWPVQSRGYRQWQCHGRVWPRGEMRLAERNRRHAAEQARRRKLILALWQRNQIRLDRAAAKLAARRLRMAGTNADA